MKPAFATAERHRSRPSDTEASGRPTSAVATMPWDTSTCDVDEVPDRAGQRDAVGGGDRHQPTPATWSMTGGASCGQTMPTRSIRTSGTRRSWAATHCAASRRSRAALAAVTASSGVP